MTDGFSLIPVLDLKGGAVVHARAGDRANYRSIETKLAATSAPADVLVGLLALAPFRAVYIADLDAIEGRGDHLAVVQALKARCPAVEFWLDSGASDVAAACAISAVGIVPVVGSETLADPAMPAQLGAALGSALYVLSLDHRGASFLGPPEIARSPDAWPDRVIVMTLDRVGSGGGPDFARLAAVKALASARRVYAAGGVRGLDDVAALQAHGIAGALVASALHDGRLSQADLVSLHPASPLRPERGGTG